MQKSARYFENTTKNHNKFWTIELDGTAITTTWGPIGKTPTLRTKEFSSEYLAEKEYNKTINSKISKGYKEKTKTQKANNAINSNSAKIAKNKSKSASKKQPEPMSASDMRFGSLEI